MKRDDPNHNKAAKLLSALLTCALSIALLPGCSGASSESPSVTSDQPTQGQTQANQQSNAQQESSTSADQSTDSVPLALSSVPEYSGEPYTEIAGNIPQFTSEEKERTSFEEYSDLDSLGRCGPAFALIGKETMPTTKRGSIGDVMPSGWHTVRYNGIVEGNYLYNRCHLIGYQLAGENANPKNLITGTRYLNTQGMLPFEDEVADYVKKTGNHVLYRATPVFDGNNLVASGVQLEAFSIEDDGKGVCFNVYCYNVQPGISINYATGDSSLDESESASKQESASEQPFVLNTSSKKFHKPNCSAVGQMKEANKASYEGTRDDLIAQGYTPCGKCKP